MVGTQELAPGGGGGIDHPYRPVENEDEEGPDKRARAVWAIRALHEQRYGPSEHPAYLGIGPEDLENLTANRVSDKLPTKVGSILLGELGIKSEDQPLN